MATCSRKLPSTRKNSSTYTKMTFGEFSYRLFAVWKRFTTWKYFIEISRVLIFSWWKMAQPSWAIWMFQKWPRKVCFTRKPVLRIMQVQRSGEISPMTTNRTFGHLVVYCTNQLPSSRHSEQKICRDYTRKFCEESILRSQAFSLTSSHRSSSWWFR